MLTFYHTLAATSASQQRLKFQQRLAARHRDIYRAHRATNRPVKHPLGDLQRARRSFHRGTAPGYRFAALDDRLVDQCKLAVSRMPGITDFFGFSAMGVTLPGCTTRSAPTNHSGTSPRCSSPTTAAMPNSLLVRGSNPGSWTERHQRATDERNHAARPSGGHPRFCDHGSVGARGPISSRFGLGSVRRHRHGGTGAHPASRRRGERPRRRSRAGRDDDTGRAGLSNEAALHAGSPTAATWDAA